MGPARTRTPHWLSPIIAVAAAAVILFSGRKKVGCFTTVLLTIFFRDASREIEWSSMVYYPIRRLAMLLAVYPS